MYDQWLACSEIWDFKNSAESVLVFSETKLYGGLIGIELFYYMMACRHTTDGEQENVVGSQSEP